LSEPVWDSSALLSNESSAGTLLHALVGYDASPSGLQLVFYAGTIGLIWLAANTRKIAARRKQGLAASI
jgi:high-affinity iron transporter